MHRALGDAGFANFVHERGQRESYTLTAVQSDAILRMTLSKLTGLEREKLIKDLEQLRVMIAEYKAILADVNLVYDIIREDLFELRKSADKRLTEISGTEPWSSSS